MSLTDSVCQAPGAKSGDERSMAENSLPDSDFVHNLAGFVADRAGSFGTRRVLKKRPQRAASRSARGANAAIPGLIVLSMHSPNMSRRLLPWASLDPTLIVVVHYI